MSGLIFDVQLGIKQALDMPDLWRKAITRLMAEFPDTLASIESAFAEQRFADIRQQAHYQAGTVVFCGTPMLQRAIHALEFACIYTPDLIEERVEELKTAFATLEEFLELHGIPEVKDILPIAYNRKDSGDLEERVQD
ncbi:MAG: Hpt domain-containing protein [Gallionella sp.]|nr:Hpt domain-containing protein [Gallionella sp.]